MVHVRSTFLVSVFLAASAKMISLLDYFYA